MPAIVRRGTAIHNNRIPRPNVGTLNAAMGPTGTFTRYSRVHSNSDNNRNNYVSLVEKVQPSTLHELRQLGFYTNTDTLDTAHQLDAEVVTAEVDHTMTKT